MRPVTPYGETKVMAERELSKLADDNFSPTYPAQCDGLRCLDPAALDIVVNNLTAIALTTGRGHLQSDGTPWRPLVHIEDISRAFLAMLEAPRQKVHDEAFNVGREEDNVQVRDIAEMVRDAVSGSGVTLAGQRGDQTCGTTADRLQQAHRHVSGHGHALARPRRGR